MYLPTVKRDDEGATGTDLELRDDEKESVEPKREMTEHRLRT